MAAAIQLNFQRFSASNGLLRFIILILSLIVLGLAAGNFNANSFEIYFLVVVVLCLVLVISGISLTLIDMHLDDGIVFKTVDYLTHLYGGWFLFNSSLAKLICASRLSRSDAEAAIRVLSGVFGLFNSGLFGWLAYLTAAERQGFPCRFSTDVRSVDDGLKVKSRSKGEVLFKSSGKVKVSMDSWSWRRSLSWTSISERLQWQKVFDGGLKQARFFTLATGMVNLIFISGSYIRLDLNEEYFLAVVCINFFLTALLHAAYLSGLSSFICEDLRILDKSYHVTGGLFLFIGATLMLASTMSKASLPNILTQDRTFSSVFGILNGLLYLYIGMKEKSKTFQVAGEDGDEGNLNHNGGSQTLLMERDQDRIIREKEKMMTKQNMMYPQRIRPAMIFDPSQI